MYVLLGIHRTTTWNTTWPSYASLRLRWLAIFLLYYVIYTVRIIIARVFSSFPISVFFHVSLFSLVTFYVSFTTSPSDPNHRELYDFLVFFHFTRLLSFTQYLINTDQFSAIFIQKGRRIIFVILLLSSSSSSFFFLAFSNGSVHFSFCSLIRVRDQGVGQFFFFFCLGKGLIFHGTIPQTHGFT